MNVQSVLHSEGYQSFPCIEMRIKRCTNFHFRMRVAKRTDDRVSVMNELIQGIQVIKMYAWETPFRSVVKQARKKEVDQIEWASYIRGIYLSTMVFTERSTLFIAILACIYEGRPITADLVFSMATFFNVLQLTAAIFYPLAVSMGAEALVRYTLF
jgi:ATP-binding cassette, subfamily C (CFTR/MRP), member 4